jgi:hypothetical protein
LARTTIQKKEDPRLLLRVLQSGPTVCVCDEAADRPWLAPFFRMQRVVDASRAVVNRQRVVSVPINHSILIVLTP